MISKPLSEIGESDVIQLVQNKISEDNQLDFKRELVATTRDARKEFVADVCAFANTRGGDLVLGIEEGDDGRAQAIFPLCFDADAEILRLENTITDSIEPKLFGVQMRAIEVTGGRVLIVRVPKSAQGIHRNRLDEKFWVRESRSKRALDVVALAERFRSLASRQDRLVEFLAERYASIATRQLPLPIAAGPCVAIHIFPLYSSVDQVIDISAVSELTKLSVPGKAKYRDFRLTFEGPMEYGLIGDGSIEAYTLTHHSGILEGVYLLDRDGNDVKGRLVEAVVLKFVKEVVPSAMRALAIDYPLVVRTTLIGAQGLCVITSEQIRNEKPHPILRSALVLPDVLINGGEDAQNPELLLKPTFDRLWQASGYTGSISYRKNAEGNFVYLERLPP